MRMAGVVAMVIFAVVPAAFAQQQLSVTGDAEIKVPPDQNDTRVRAVRAAVTQLGVAQKDIQTDFIQLGMQYENDGITAAYYYTGKSMMLMLHDVSRWRKFYRPR